MKKRMFMANKLSHDKQLGNKIHMAIICLHWTGYWKKCGLHII